MTPNIEVLATVEDKVDPGHSAVLVIDVQNDFCDDEGYLHRLGLDINASQAMVPRLESFIEQARTAKVNVIFVQGIYDRRYLAGPFIEKDLRAGLKVERCVDGSWGADFYRVRPLPSELIVKKHRYSAFVGTGLDELLRKKNIETLILTGVTTNVCVESTARDGFMRDYYIVFLQDCTATYSKEAHDSTLKNMKRHFGIVASSTDIINVWQKLQDAQLSASLCRQRS